MRSLHRTLSPEVRRAIVLLAIADGLVGASFGAIATGAGLPVWVPVLMSLVVFAGASQFMYVAIVASGGNPFAAAIAGLLANARHIIFGFSIADVVGRRLGHRLVASHLILDETVAFVVAENHPDRRRAAFYICGTLLFVLWNIGTFAGALGGAAISNTDALGLDAAFPAVLLALIFPSLRDKRIRVTSLVGAVIAVATTPFLAPGLSVIAALVAMAVVVPFRERVA